MQSMEPRIEERITGADEAPAKGRPLTGRPRARMTAISGPAHPRYRVHVPAMSSRYSGEVVKPCKYTGTEDHVTCTAVVVADGPA